MDKVFQIKPEDQDILEHLEVLVNYTKQHLTANPIYKDKLNPKQTLVVAIFAAVNSYTEAIFELCKQGRPEAAIVILRSLIEAFINSNYVLSFPNKNNLWLFAIEDSYYRRSLVQQMQEYYSRYPKRQGILTDEKLEDMKQIVEKELLDYEKNLGVSFKSKGDFDKAWGGLIDRAKKTDKRLAKRQKDNAGGLESTYILVYRYLSEYTHLQMRGINHFWIKTPEGETLILDRNPDNMTHVLVMCYIIYLYFAKRLKQYKIISCPMGKFDKYVDITLLHNETENKKA